MKWIDNNFPMVIIGVWLCFPAMILVAETEYVRSDWGRWADYDRDCQNTRAEVLIERSLTPVVLSDNGCRVVVGMWIDHYTGEKLTLAGDIDIDHMVPVYWAHVNGGHAWPRLLKRVFYNDWDNLAVTRNTVNRQKGAKAPDQWIPLGCHAYMRHWKKMAKKYQLTGAITSPACEDT